MRTMTYFSGSQFCATDLLVEDVPTTRSYL